MDNRKKNITIDSSLSNILAGSEQVAFAKLLQEFINKSKNESKEDLFHLQYLRLIIISGKTALDRPFDKSKLKSKQFNAHFLNSFSKAFCFEPNHEMTIEALIDLIKKNTNEEFFFSFLNKKLFSKEELNKTFLAKDVEIAFVMIADKTITAIDETMDKKRIKEAKTFFNKIKEKSLSPEAWSFEEGTNTPADKIRKVILNLDEVSSFKNQLESFFKWLDNTQLSEKSMWMSNLQKSINDNSSLIEAYLLNGFSSQIAFKYASAYGLTPESIKAQTFIRYVSANLLQPDVASAILNTLQEDSCKLESASKFSFNKHLFDYCKKNKIKQLGDQINFELNNLIQKNGKFKAEFALMTPKRREEIISEIMDSWHNHLTNKVIEINNSKITDEEYSLEEYSSLISIIDDNLGRNGEKRKQFLIQVREMDTQKSSQKSSLFNIRKNNSNDLKNKPNFVQNSNDENSFSLDTKVPRSMSNQSLANLDSQESKASSKTDQGNIKLFRSNSEKNLNDRLSSSTTSELSEKGDANLKANNTQRDANLKPNTQK